MMDGKSQDAIVQQSLLVNSVYGSWEAETEVLQRMSHLELEFA